MHSQNKMSLKNLINIIIIFFCLLSFSEANELKIKVKINNEIITNIDIENEKKYLLLLNDKLNQLSKRDFSILAKNSLIKEIVKKKEINKRLKKRNNFKQIFR